MPKLSEDDSGVIEEEKERINFLMEDAKEELTEWESDFLEKMEERLDHGRELTEGQIETIGKIEEKIKEKKSGGR